MSQFPGSVYAGYILRRGCKVLCIQNSPKIARLTFSKRSWMGFYFKIVILDKGRNMKRVEVMFGANRTWRRMRARYPEWVFEVR